MTDGTTSVSYAYDADGMRTGKTVGSTTTKYYYVGSRLTDVTDGTNTLHIGYDGFGAESLTYNGTRYYYVKNAQGDVIGLVNGSGAVVAEYAYDAWGNILSISGSGAGTVGAANPIRYRGYVYDAETGLYYVSSRYYDPELGRWINADNQLNTAAGVLGYNVFAYCHNNPVKLTDPDGHFPFLAITAAIGAVAGAVIGGIKAAKSGKSVWKGALKGAAIGGLIGLGAGAVAGVMLAGSATASVASVVIGAKAVVATIGSAGIVAGAKMIADNVSQACSSAPQVFWSGGNVAKNAAKQVASEVGGKSLEMTRLGTYLEQIDASYTAWQAASSNFANVATNTSSSIYSIQNTAGVGLQSIWATIEYPLLQGRDIIYGVASQSGSIQIMP